MNKKRKTPIKQRVVKKGPILSQVHKEIKKRRQKALEGRQQEYAALIEMAEDLKNKTGNLDIVRLVNELKKFDQERLRKAHKYKKKILESTTSEAKRLQKILEESEKAYNRERRTRFRNIQHMKEILEEKLER